jgi:hypothetical protein
MVLRHLAQGFRLTSLDGDPQASLKVEMDLTGVVLAATVVVFSDNLSQQVIQRVNRLIKGSGFALKSYHRAGGRIRMNGGSKYHALPGEMTLARSTSHGEGMTVWSWFSDSGAPHATTEAPVVTAYPSCDYCSDPLTEPSIGHKCPEPMPVPVPVPAPAPVTPPMAA